MLETGRRAVVPHCQDEGDGGLHGSTSASWEAPTHLDGHRQMALYLESHPAVSRPSTPTLVTQAQEQSTDEEELSDLSLADAPDVLDSSEAAPDAKPEGGSEVEVAEVFGFAHVHCPSSGGVYLTDLLPTSSLSVDELMDIWEQVSIFAGELDTAFHGKFSG